MAEIPDDPIEAELNAWAEDLESGKETIGGNDPVMRLVLMQLSESRKLLEAIEEHLEHQERHFETIESHLAKLVDLASERS